MSFGFALHIVFEKWHAIIPKSDKNSNLAYFPPFVNFIPMLSTKIPVYRVTFIIPRIFCDFPSFYNGPTHLSFCLMSNMSLKRQIFPRSQRKWFIRYVSKHAPVHYSSNSTCITYFFYWSLAAIFSYKTGM